LLVEWVGDIGDLSVSTFKGCEVRND